MRQAEKYVHTIYLKKSFSAAARELYISQPALSTIVKKLESELGFKIFNRSKTPITLTPEGEIYIEYLETAIENERDMQRRINSIASHTLEKLAVGGSGFLAYHLFPKACGEFHRRFPDVEVKIDFGAVGPHDNLLFKLNQGTLDFIISYSCDETKYAFIPLLTERFVVAMRRDLPGAEALKAYALTRDEILSGKVFQERIISDYSLFDDIAFLRIGRSGSTWRHVSDFLENRTVSRCNIYNSRSLDKSYDMMLYGNGAIITADSIIATRPEKGDEIYYFLINSPGSIRHAKIVYKKDTPPSDCVKNFISVMLEMTQSKYKLFGYK